MEPTDDIAALAVVAEPGDLKTALPRFRRELLERLAEPDSATGLGQKLGLARQKINYHLRELEQAGLIVAVEARKKRGFVETFYRATARAYVLLPDVVGPLDPAAARDAFSSAYLVAQAAQTLRDVSTLRQRAKAVAKPLTTYSLESEVAFASPADLTAFTEGLAEAFATLIERHARPAAPKARLYRITAGLHPVITKSEAAAEAERRRRSQCRDERESRS